VRGVQSEGVAAVVKHWVLNSQETHREYVSSDASDRTLWEVYLPPFRAAVDAGVASVMCGYNAVNGSACCGGGDGKLANELLRRRMGFQGFMMTDWWGLASVHAAKNGVDQEQPGVQRGKNNQGPFTTQGLRSSGADIDGMARRVLTGMLMSSAFDSVPGRPPTCTPGQDCAFPLYQAVATNANHVAIAREMASASTVLLKNEGGVLPLARGARVLLLGSACASPFHRSPSEGQWDTTDYYSMGGSGRVIAGASAQYTIERGLREREAKGDLERLTTVHGEQVWTALEAMRGGIDVVIACGGARTSEGHDRPNLRLDQDGFLSDIARRARQERAKDAAFPPLVVVALAPGAIVAPWAGNAHAALAMFLPGQETGRALADVLLGDVIPSGRLPVTFPKNEHGVVPVCWDNRCPYSERLKVGWRGLHGQPVAFDFGHGLSYTSFEHSWTSTPSQRASSQGAAPTANGGAVVLRLDVTVRNTGSRAGADVVQLYLRYPAAAGEPELVMRDFRKTATLQPGEAAQLSFGVTAEGLSTWDSALNSGNGDWQRVRGSFVAVIGRSSRNHSLSHSFEA